MLKLRDYQAEVLGGIAASMEVHRYTLAVLPTGGGKTVCFASLIHDHTGGAAAIVHRRELLGQISEALGRLDVKHRIVAPPKTVKWVRRRHLRKLGRSFVDQQAPVGVVSVQTVTSRGSANNADLQRWVQQVTLAVYDEGHHYVEKGQWGKAVRAFDRARHLFVTATPERADGTGLGAGQGGFCEAMVEGPTTRQLIDWGYLSPFKYYAPDTDLDVSGIPLTANGDLNTREMRKRVTESHLVGDVVDHYLRLSPDASAIVFAESVATAEELAAEFNRRGAPAAALSGETEDGLRERTMAAFEGAGDPLRVLVNVDLFDEGLDVAGVECVILARPTESLGKFLQMVGRVLRVVYADGFDLSTAEGRRAAIAAGGKPHGLIIDPVRNWERHGMPDWPRVWSLEGKEKGSRSSASDTIRQRVCLSCTQPYEVVYWECPYCGALCGLVGRSAPESVDGDLRELDVAAMAALFEKMRRADMSDDEFMQDQINRHVPPIGQGAGLKRHREAKRRRQVLRELVAWWVGSQPEGRELAEKHRRFFHRFGVDIGTAFTLNARETNALIEKIQQRFGEDMR